jgi:hypothetical protein
MKYQMYTDYRAADIFSLITISEQPEAFANSVDAEFVAAS